MDMASTTELIQTYATTLSGAVVVVIGIVVGLTLGYFVFKWAFRKLKGSIR